MLIRQRRRVRRNASRTNVSSRPQSSTSQLPSQASDVTAAPWIGGTGSPPRRRASGRRTTSAVPARGLRPGPISGPLAGARGPGMSFAHSCSGAAPPDPISGPLAGARGPGMSFAHSCSGAAPPDPISGPLAGARGPGMSFAHSCSGAAPPDPISGPLAGARGPGMSFAHSCSGAAPPDPISGPLAGARGPGMSFAAIITPPAPPSGGGAATWMTEGQRYSRSITSTVVDDGVNPRSSLHPAVVGEMATVQRLEHVVGDRRTEQPADHLGDAPLRADAGGSGADDPDGWPAAP